MIISTDILIKTMFEAAFNDIRKNPWILDDIFGGLATDPISRLEYGYKEVIRAREWFLNNDIKIFLQYRNDDPVFPAITLVHAGMSEMLDRTSLSDSRLGEEVDITKIKTETAKVHGLFTPTEYDPGTGKIKVDQHFDLSVIASGQLLVSARTGKTYPIKELAGNGFIIPAGVVEDFRNAYVIPAIALWNLERELTFVHEDFQIGLHTQSNVNQNMWLHQLVWYILLRYKEAYLDSRGFELSTLRSGPIELNPNFSQADQVYSRYITLQGQVQADWIKYIAPKLAKITETVYIADGTATPPPTYDPESAVQMEEDRQADAEVEDLCERDPLLGNIRILGGKK